ncbi:rhamnan synthesis F family protein [Ancylobacter polymorphus]|uniref:Glycosyltransferase involved in cell wall biosynthesis n=1 Tax=Ancylobacter polymorphus TaxID=223390 RepID=A0ABU0B884_9HYPH|nr:rhamnan synthesis F family protein [Ancylobacter polymorphus]MDQ0301615.1 glycosyltransferase involved in cell wall biosynthesis [Ancylobacter polymorphus]
MNGVELDARFRELLELSGFVDLEFYRSAVGRPHLIDPIAHYADVGWRIGVPPNARFDGDFIWPFYVAAGLEGPPAFHWIALTAAGFSLPANEVEAQARAEHVRRSQIFDPMYYGRRLPEGVDPALHYVVIGEVLGWPCAHGFDPEYYRERYPDIAKAGISPLYHYENHGRLEGRRGISVVDQLRFPPLPEGGASAVLVVSHEASRTGAPVLGWNLVRGLRGQAPVISLLLRGGELEENYREESSVCIGPLTRDDWHPSEARRLARRLISEYNIAYAVSNSIETQIVVPELVRNGVPVVSLVHEFAAYTRPLAKMRNVFDWASHVVFPAEISAKSSFNAFPGLDERQGIHILSQGRNDPPAAASESKVPANIPACLDRSALKDAFIVIGVGQVQLRKGVDLFVGAAQAARRLRPDIPFQFVWVGDGFDPEADIAYSAYLAYQIENSDLGDSFHIVKAVEDLEPIYAAADAFFLSSRLDPQPNVAIDAISRGIPTVCFRDACGTAEILDADDATRFLIAPHTDVHGAAEILCDIADNKAGMSKLRQDVARVGRAAFDFDAYVAKVHQWGLDAANALPRADWIALQREGVVDAELAIPPESSVLAPGEAEWRVMVQWSVMGMTKNPSSNPQFRRPCEGFNPQIYAEAHAAECVTGSEHPLAHWLRTGRPTGRWSRKVLAPDGPGTGRGALPQRSALHAHLYYADLAGDLRDRLSRNRLECDLFITTDTDAKARHIRSVFNDQARAVDVTVVDNRGRDVGPFLMEFLPKALAGNYDVVGHVHGKRSLSTDAAMGEGWRTFLFEHLLGGRHAMLDTVMRAFSKDTHLGLVMAEEAHLVGWNENKEIAQNLARKLGIGDLPDYFDFPLGTMFWARTQALRPLMDLGLHWDDFPMEPLPDDGTLLHAVERLLPFIVEKAGFQTASVRVPGVTW